MYLNSEIKQEIFEKYSFAKEAKDTGSPEAQVALFTYRIKHLTEHLKQNKKDVSTRVGLLRLVGKRLLDKYAGLAGLHPFAHLLEMSCRHRPLGPGGKE